MELKFKIHSVVDVITNSSTIIYTYQDDSIQPAKELIDEMLRLFGVTDKTADDIFKFSVKSDCDCDEDDDECECGCDDEYGDRWLVIKPKDEKYAPLAEKMKKFLNSPETEEGYN